MTSTRWSVPRASEETSMRWSSRMKAIEPVLARAVCQVIVAVPGPVKRRYGPEARKLPWPSLLDSGWGKLSALARKRAATVFLSERKPAAA